MANTILLVDDVTMFLEIQRSFLRLSTAKIVTARDGVEALRAVDEHDPNLVFMDLHMPNLDGAECCAAIKADPRRRLLPVVLITAAGKEDDRKVCLRAGCDDFLFKPLDRDLFLEKARKYVPGIERRERRVPFKTPVRFRVFGVPLSGTVHDISVRGVYIAADYPVDPGSVIEVSFTLPDIGRTQIEARGRISWVNTGGRRRKGDMPPGFGVEFAVIPKEAGEAIRKHVTPAS
jgi:CheY-like chemotaxis protein